MSKSADTESLGVLTNAWALVEAIALAAASADIEITAGGIRKIASALGPEIARREELTRQEGAELALREAGWAPYSGDDGVWLDCAVECGQPIDLQSLLGGISHE